jgi:hypothetical protein
VHARILKPWRGRLPSVFSSYHVFSPPLSGLNWRSLTPPGGPGPLTSKMATLSTGSAHTPLLGPRTLSNTFIQYTVSMAWAFFLHSKGSAVAGNILYKNYSLHKFLTHHFQHRKKIFYKRCWRKMLTMRIQFGIFNSNSLCAKFFLNNEHFCKLKCICS